MGGVGGLNKILYVRFITVQNARSEYNTERKCVSCCFPCISARTEQPEIQLLPSESLCTLLHSTSKALQDSERKTLRHPMHLWGEHSVLWFIARTQQKQNTNQNENDRNQEPCNRKKKLPQSKAVQTVIHTPAAATVRHNQKMIRTGERQEQFLSTPLTPSQ